MVMKRNTLVCILSIALLVGCSSTPFVSTASSSEKQVIDQDKEPDNTENLTDQNSDEEYLVSEDEGKHEEELEVEIGLDEKQKNSVVMLNYLSTVSQEIADSKNSRIMLESITDQLLGNMNPNVIDEETKEQLNSLVMTVHNIEMVGIKRERLEYIYNQNKARAIKESMPNPILVLSAASSLDWKRLAGTVLMMTVDSINRYDTYQSEIKTDMLKENWDLDDQEKEIFINKRLRAFNYIVDITQKYGLSEEMTLSEKAIKDFIAYKTNDNIAARIQFLEDEKETYQYFANYWIVLADAYYQYGEYQKCLNAVQEYQKIYAKIFRKDFDYANLMPEAITAAFETLGKEEAIPVIKDFVDSIVPNTNIEDWNLRYFAAQTYVELYHRTSDDTYLQSAYKLLLSNINYLYENQILSNQTYLSDIVEKTLSEDEKMFMTSQEIKEEEKKRKDYYKTLKDNRKTELPEIYEPLGLNCELLFAVVDKLHLSSSEKKRISDILQTDTNGVFMNPVVNSSFSFQSSQPQCKATYKKETIELPVSILNEGADITVTVQNGSSTEIIDDWKIQSVNRPDSFEEFKAIYTSEKAKSIKWNADSMLKVEIDNPFGDTIEMSFRVSEYADYFLIPDKVVFEQV